MQVRLTAIEPSYHMSPVLTFTTKFEDVEGGADKLLFAAVDVEVVRPPSRLSGSTPASLAKLGRFPARLSSGYLHQVEFDIVLAQGAAARLDALRKDGDLWLKGSVQAVFWGSGQKNVQFGWAEVVQSDKYSGIKIPQSEWVDYMNEWGRTTLFLEIRDMDLAEQVVELAAKLSRSPDEIAMAALKEYIGKEGTP